MVLLKINVLTIFKCSLDVLENIHNVVTNRNIIEAWERECGLSLPETGSGWHQVPELLGPY